MSARKLPRPPRGRQRPPRRVLLASVVACVAAAFAGGLATPAAGETPIRVGGRVLADGRPLAGARVELEAIEDRYSDALRRLTGEPVPAVARATSGDDGRFALVAPGDGMWRLVVSHRGFVPLQRWLAPLTAPRDVEDAALERDVGLAVRVVDATGHPLPGAEVRVRESFYAPPRFRRTWSPALRHGTADAGGRLRLPRAPDEGLVLAAWAPGRLEAEARVEPGGGDVTLALAPGVERRLVVRDGDAPAAGVVVRLGEAAWPLAATGEDGAVAVALPAAGSVRLELDAGGGRRTPRLDLPLPAAPADAPEAVPAVVVELPPAWRIEGVVEAAGDGGAVPGALVWPRGWASDAVRSDARGRFRLLRVAAEEVEVVAAAPGYRQARRPVAPDERELPRLVLAPEAAVAGTVVDAAGAPVAGAEVWLRESGAWQPWNVEESSSSGPEARTWSDEAGGFRFAGAPGQAFDLRASAPGYAPADGTAVAGERPAVLVLEEGRRVAGRLVDEDGEPVAGARVGLAWVPEMRPRTEIFVGTRQVFDFETTSGGDGGFVLADLPAGELVAVADGRPRRVERELGIVRVPEQGGVDLGEVTLPRAAALDLRVVDEEGAPVPGASVSPQRLPGNSAGGGVTIYGRDDGAATSDAEGRVRVDGLTPDEAVTLDVRHEGFRSTELPAIVPPLDEELEVVLHRGLALSGRVVASDGRPAAGADLDLLLESTIAYSGGSTSQSMHRGGRADAEGAFAFEALEPASRVVLAATWEGERASLELSDLPDRGTVGPLLLRLEPSPRLLGFVELPSGQPAAGAQVTMTRRSEERPGPPPRQETAVADAAGRFSMVAAGPGPVRVEAVLDERMTAAEIVLVPGDTEVALTLDEPDEAGVSGRVVDVEGRPVRAQVSLSCVEGCTSSTAAGTDSAGRFAFRGIEPGRRRLQARAGALVAPERTLEVADRWIGGLELVLRPGAAIEGTLRGVEEGEVLRVHVVASPSGGGGGASGDVDLRGGYRIAGITPGRWRVSARSEATGAWAEGEVEVHPGDEVARLDLDLTPRGVRLSGKVTLDGRPAADLGLQLVREDGSGGTVAHVRTAYDGGFRFEGIEPGRYRLEVQPEIGVPPVRRPVDLSTDREIRLDVVVSAVTGRVVAAVGAPPGGLRAVLVDSSGGELYAGVDAEGRFHFPAVAAGPYLLAVRRGERTVASLPLEVAAADVASLLLPIEE